MRTVLIIFLACGLLGCSFSGIDEKGRVGDSYIVSTDPSVKAQDRSFKETVELQEEIIRRQQKEIERLNQQLQELEYQKMLNKNMQKYEK